MVNLPEPLAVSRLRMRDLARNCEVEGCLIDLSESGTWAVEANGITTRLVGLASVVDEFRWRVPH